MKQRPPLLPVLVPDASIEIPKLAAEVNRDLAGKPLDERFREAMRRCKGAFDPVRVRSALAGTP